MLSLPGKRKTVPFLKDPEPRSSSPSLSGLGTSQFKETAVQFKLQIEKENQKKVNLMLANKRNEADEWKKRHKKAKKMKMQPQFLRMNTASTESLDESDMALFTKTLSFDAYQRAALESQKVDLS